MVQSREEFRSLTTVCVICLLFVYPKNLPLAKQLNMNIHINAMIVRGSLMGDGEAAGVSRLPRSLLRVLTSCPSVDISPLI